MTKKKETDSKKNSQNKFQKWLLNIAIVCLAVTIFSFMLSSTKRFSGNAKKIDLSQSTVVKTPQYADICIEVLNGSGITGMAGKYTEYLRQNGFDVIYTGNADKMDYPETFIFANDTAETVLHPLLLSLDFTKNRIEYNQTMDSHINFRIILGKDCERLPVFAKIRKMENNF